MTTGVLLRRPLRSQTYNMVGRVVSSCDALQASAKGTDASKDLTLSDNGGISNLESGNLVSESVDTSDYLVIAKMLRFFGIDDGDDEMSPVCAVNLSEEVEHDLQLKQRELEELIFSSQNTDLSIADEGLEEGELDFMFGDSSSFEEHKSDDLLLSEHSLENGNDVSNLERSFREEPKSHNASPNYEDLDGGTEESHHEDIIDKKGSESEVRDEKKRKRGPLTEERKANKRKYNRIRRAEKNKQLGVKRLKLEPVAKPKKVEFCRHYMVGRCYEGDKCKFSHDATPLTKSSPCSFFARNSCMKGHDCPFDHELSKYPCNNFVSKGFCSRGADCLLKHAVSDINNEGAASHTKLSKLSENQVCKKPIPKGINFISQVRSPITNASKPEPELKLNEAVSNELDKIKNSKESAKKEPLKMPKGINFLSFGKSPLGIAANKEKGTVGSSAETVRQTSTGSDSEEKRNECDKFVSSISTLSSSSALQNPFLNQDSRNGVQRALQSTLAFAAKIDSGIRLNIPTVNPFDVSRHDS